MFLHVSRHGAWTGSVSTFDDNGSAATSFLSEVRVLHVFRSVTSDEVACFVWRS